MHFLMTRINNLDILLALQLKILYIILTYGCEVWGHEIVEIIEKVQNDFLKRKATAKKGTPLYMLRGELGRIPSTNKY